MEVILKVNYVEYIGFESGFFDFLELFNTKLEKENRSVSLWCNLDFLSKINKNYKMITPIYYREYPYPFSSIKDSIRNGNIREVFREIIRRIKYRNYIKYLKCGENNKIPCCLTSKNGILEVLEDVKEDDFYGKDNTLVLRRYERASGMFSHLLIMLPYLKWADTNNLSIYFDMSCGASVYRENAGENAWEYFYKQIGTKPVSTNGTIISQNFELSKKYKIPYEPSSIPIYKGLHYIYNKYIKLNDKMFSLVEKNWARITEITRGGEDIRCKISWYGL